MNVTSWGNNCFQFVTLSVTALKCKVFSVHPDMQVTWNGINAEIERNVRVIRNQERRLLCSLPNPLKGNQNLPEIFSHVHVQVSCTRGRQVEILSNEPQNIIPSMY